MKTGLRKPRFRLADLSLLVAVLAIVLATLPADVSPVVGGIIVLGALLHSIIDRITPIEWLVLASIAFVLFSLTLPSVTTRCRRGTITTTATSPPVSIPAPAP